MNPVRTIPRTAANGYLKAALWPLRRAARLLPGDDTGPARAADLAIARADAAVREVVGMVLRDRDLRQDAKRRREAALERGHALRLREEAEEQRVQARDRTYGGREEAGRKRRQARDQAQRRRGQAESKARAQKQRLNQAVKKRKQTARKAARQTEEVIESSARRNRLEALDDRSGALEEREAALAARDEAQRLRNAASTAKSERKRR